MSSVRIEQKGYEMPPRDRFTVTHIITVADIDRSARMGCGFKRLRMSA